jgi:ABC-type dipeptide/oligopeptide/nickel transport system permease subunit
MSREPGSDEARSLWSDAWATLRGNRAAISALWLLVAMALVVVVAPFFLPFSYEQTDWDNIAVGPSLASGHLFGTDSHRRALRRDRRLCRRAPDQLMMRIVDVLYALPLHLRW